MIARLLSAALAFVVSCAPAAHAQPAISFPFEPPAAMVRDAFATNYGNALLDEFARSVEKSAVIGCLKSNNLDTAKLKERGRELFQKWGSRAMESLDANIDHKKYESELTALVGAGGAREFERLRKTADVQRYLAIERPARLAKTLDVLVEQFDIYVRIKRIGLAGIHPLGTGNDKLLSLNPTEASNQALERFIRQRKSAGLNRFLDLSDSANQAMLKAVAAEFAGKISPATYFGGVEADLGEICIGPRQ